MFTKRMSSLKLDAVEVKGSTRLNSWHLSLALHVLIVFTIFQLTFKPPIAEMPDNKATIELVFVTAKPYYRVMNDLLTIKKDKILDSSQQLANNERSLNPELLDKNKNLENEIRSMQNNIGFAESYSRENLDMVFPNEILVEINQKADQDE